MHGRRLKSQKLLHPCDRVFTRQQPCYRDQHERSRKNDEGERPTNRADCFRAFSRHTGRPEFYYQLRGFFHDTVLHLKIMENANQTGGGMEAQIRERCNAPGNVAVPEAKSTSGSIVCVAFAHAGLLAR